MTVKITRDNNLSGLDLIRNVTRRTLARQEDQVRKLRGLVVTTFAQSMSGLDDKSFGRTYADRQVKGRTVRRSSLGQKWIDGEVAPSRTKIESMDMEIVGVSALNKHSVFPLLQDIPLSLRYINSKLSHYTKPAEEIGRAWRFPDEKERLDTGTLFPVMDRDDVENLVHRCDLDGFTVILGLVREAEALGDGELHLRRMISLYRSTPAVLAIPWFNKHKNLLTACIDRIHARCFLSCQLLHAHWDRIEMYATQEAIDKWFQSPTHSMISWRALQKISLDVVEVTEPRLDACPRRVRS